MKKALLLAIFCVTVAFVNAQEDYEITLSVAASAPETTQAIESINKDDIEKLHATDLATVLNKGLGLGITRNGAYGNMSGVSMRGFGSGRVAFLINGVPVNSSQNGGFDIFSIDVASIERIEVIQGGSDSKYNVSGAMGGVINIITVKNKPEGLSFKAQIENTSYIPTTYLARHTYKPTQQAATSLIDGQKLALNLGYGFENSSIAIDMFGVRATNEFIFLDDYGYRLRTGNEVYDAGLNATYTQNLRDNSSIIFSGNVYAGDKNIPSDMSSAVINNQKDLNFRESIILDLKAVTDVLDTEAFVNHASENQTFGTSEHKLNTLTLTNRWTWYALDNLFVKFSGDYKFSHLNSTNTGIVQGHDGGISATLEYYPLENISIIPSTKLLINENSIVPIPKLGLLFTVSENFAIKNNWFRVFKFPNFNDLYWGGDGGQGNPDLKNEDGFGADLIVEYAIPDLFSGNVSVFATATKNSIHWANIHGVWSPQNIGEAFIWGSDIALTSNFSEHIQFSVGYSLLLSYILTGSYTFYTNIRMPYMPEHRIHASVEVPWKTGNVVLSGSYESERFATYTSKGNASPLDPFVLLDLTVNQNIGEHFAAFASINNILNEDYFLVEGYPMPKLNVKIGFSYEM